VRRIGGRTEYQHIAELDQYDTIGEQHTDNTGSELAEPEHAVDDGSTGKHQPKLHDRCISAAIKLYKQQPVDHCSEQQLNHTEQLFDQS